MRFNTRILAAACILAFTMMPQARANVARGGFGGAVVNQTTWKAGTDQVGTWIGTGFDANQGYGRLTAQDPNPSARTPYTLMQAIPIPAAGTYSISIDTRLTNGSTQDSYWLVLAVSNGTTLNLTNPAIPYTVTQAGVKTLARNTSPNGNAGGTWKTYTSSFSISAADRTAYSHVVIALVASRSAGQINDFDNIATDMPFVASGGGVGGLKADFFTLGVAPSSLASINWSTNPTYSCNVENVNWINTSQPFYPNGPSDRFAVRTTGTINITTAGNHVFSLGSDDGAQLLIDGASVVNYPGQRGFGWTNGTVNLSKGRHTFQVLYFENGGSEALVLRWQPPSATALEVVPWEAFESQRRVRVATWQESGRPDR